MGIWRVLLLTGFCAAFCSAQQSASPTEVQGLILEQRLGEKLPYEPKFADESGQEIAFGQIFDGLRPVILTFNYSNCPNLCSLQLNSLVDSLRQVDLELGRDYRIATVSLDHLETQAAAKEQQRKYFERLGRPEALMSGWTFLRGSRGAIDQVAKAAGFPFRYLPEINEYSHRPIFVFASPKGVITRYLEAIGNGVVARDLKLNLLEAGEGRIGSLADQIYFFCFHLDPDKGWTPNAMLMMSIGGALTLAVFGLVLLSWWRSDVQKDRNTLAEERREQEASKP